MKKLLVLIIPVLFLMFACNNKPSGETPAVTQDSMAAPADSATAQADTTEVPVGDPTMTAQVFEDATANPVGGATVLLKEGTKSIETVNTDEHGYYRTTKAVSGHTYTFTCSKTGYISLTKTAAYTDSSSLPAFALKK